MGLLAAVIRPTAFFARLPANVTVIVPIPAVMVPTAVVTPPVPIFGSASSAASIFATSVLFVADQLIAAVVKPSKVR